jgi:hypothetical protein
MPILMANLGAEMLYILDQRLRAQWVAVGPRDRVLKVVAFHVFQEKLYDEAFRLQRVYDTARVWQVFANLAHSSVMRLSKARYGTPCGCYI